MTTIAGQAPRLAVSEANEPIRMGFGRDYCGPVNANERIVALCGGPGGQHSNGVVRPSGSPTVYLEVGVAEQNLVTVACGMAAAGRHSVHEQLRGVQHRPQLGADQDDGGSQRPPRQDRRFMPA